MENISLISQGVFILVFLSPIVTNVDVSLFVIDILWIIAIILGILEYAYKYVKKLKSRFSFKSKLSLGISIFLLLFYIFGLGLDQM